MKYILFSLLLFGFQSQLLGQELIPYRLDKKWGYADNTGKIIIEPQYDQVRRFGKDGFAQVYKDNLCALIDGTGKEVIPFKYTRIFEFHDGLAAACKGGEYHWLQGEIIGGEWGFINENGEEIIPFNYYRVENFVNGYAIVQNENNWGNWGVIDNTGKLVLPFKYPSYSFDMRPFPGLRWDEKEKGKLLYRPSQKDETWRQIDLTGKLTGKKVNDIHGDYFDEEENKTITKSINGKYALLNENGKELTEYIYNRGIYFYNGLNQTKVSIDTEEKDSTGKFIPLFGIINKKGDLVFPCEYPSINIKNGVATLQNKEGNYALADLSGKFLTNWTEYEVEYLGENIFSRQKDEKHIELYSLDGKKIGSTEISYKKDKFSEGLLGIANQDKKWGYINTQGELVIDYKYQHVDNFEENFAKVDMNINQYKVPDDGYINKKGIEFFKNKKNISTKYFHNKYSIVDEYERIIVADLNFAKKLENGKIIYKNSDNFYQIMDQEQKKYIKRKLVDLIPITLYEPVVTLKSKEYYMGFTNDSSYIYNSDLIETVAQIKDKNFKNFEFTQQTGLVIKKLADGYQLLNLDNNNLTDKYSYISNVNGENFIATTKDGKKGLISYKNEIIIPFSNQKLFMDNKDVLIATTSSGKKLINVDFYNFKGKKINEFKIDNYRKVLSLNEFYILENTKTKKYGYLYIGHVSTLRFDAVSVESLSNNKFILLKENNQYEIYTPSFIKVAGPLEECIVDGKFLHVKEKGKYGILGVQNEKLTQLLACKYDYIPFFGRAKMTENIAVKNDGKFFYVNTQGEKSFPMEFEYAEQFSQEFTRVRQNGKTGFINDKGSWLIQPNYDYLDYEYNQNDQPVFYGRKNNKTIFLNHKEENILPPGVDSMDFYHFQDNFVWIINKDKKVGLMDYDGNLLCPMKYEGIYGYNLETEKNSLTVFQIKSGKHYGLINESGKEITPIIYDWFNMAEDNYLAEVLKVLEAKQKGKYGLISFTGEQILPCEYDRFDWFFEGSEDYPLLPMKKNGKWGLIGNYGKIIVEPLYDKIYVDYDIQEFFINEKTQQAYSVVLNGKTGIISNDGSTLIPCEYKKILFNHDCADEVIFLFNGKKQGVYKKGEIILPAQYDQITCEFFNDQTIYITKTGKKYQFHNPEGTPINEYQYDDFRWVGNLFMVSAKRNNIWYNLDVQGRETQSQE